MQRTAYQTYAVTMHEKRFDFVVFLSCRDVSKPMSADEIRKQIEKKRMREAFANSAWSGTGATAVRTAALTRPTPGSAPPVLPGALLNRTAPNAATPVTNLQGPPAAKKLAVGAGFRPTPVSLPNPNANPNPNGAATSNAVKPGAAAALGSPRSSIPTLGSPTSVSRAGSGGMNDANTSSSVQQPTNTGPVLDVDVDEAEIEMVKRLLEQK
jgi:hypothetical protein